MTWTWALVAALVLLVACSQRSPVDTLTAYLNARVAADEAQLHALACDEWEPQVAIEAQSFRGMNVTLEDMTCQEDGTDDDATVVTCDGHMAFDYNGEIRERPLGSYRMVQEDGEWKMCGEA